MANETRSFIEGDQRLESLLEWPADDAASAAGHGSGGEPPAGGVRGGVVVAHPYPPHGGNMGLPVIHRIAKSCRQVGFASLRFNFRSAGASEGEFSGTEEHRDVAAAVSHMSERLGETRSSDTGAAASPLGLAGWSFGSIQSARAVAELPAVGALSLVGFGVRWDQLPPDTLERLSGYAGPILAVCSEHDEFAAPKDVEQALSDLGMDYRIQVIHGADHFLEGRHQEVGGMVADFFDEVL